MKTNLYSIFDTASGTYGKTIFAEADGIVMREFQNMCIDAEHPIGQHPEDYSLHRLGNFNNTTGLLTNEENECLANGIEMVALSRNVNRDNLEKLDQNLPAN